MKLDDVFHAMAEAKPHDRGAIAAAFSGMTITEIGSTSRVTDGWCPEEPDSERKALEVEEARAVVRSARETSDRDFGIVYLATVLGLRQIEIRRLRWKDVNSDKIRVRGKGGSYRTVPTGMPTKTLLGDPERPDDPVFTSYRGQSISASGIRDIIYRHLGDVRPDATPHDLRHTALTLLLEQGDSLRTAMEIAGHSNVESHEIYAATSKGWLLREWKAHHPIGGGEPSTIEVEGKKARTIPIGDEFVRDVRKAFKYFSNSKQIRNRFYSKVGVSLSEVRDLGGATALEWGAHPFLVSRMMGITTGSVLRRGLDRLGDKAQGQREAGVRSLAQTLI